MTTARERADALTQSIGGGLHPPLVVIAATEAEPVQDSVALDAPVAATPSRIRRWLRARRLRGR